LHLAQSARLSDAIYRTGISHLELRVRLAYGILIATYLGVALTILCSCQPFHHFWQVNPDPGKLCQATNSPVYVLVILVLNIVTDMYLLSIPLPVITLWDAVRRGGISCC
jgi:hypothetical protein